jgi:hypothetical protein
VWTSFTGTATLDRALVFVTTVNCGATAILRLANNIKYINTQGKKY